MSDYITSMLIQGFGPFRDNTLVLCSVILDRKCAPLRDGLIVMLSISPLNFCLFRGCEFFSGTGAYLQIIMAKSRR